MLQAHSYCNIGGQLFDWFHIRAGPIRKERATRAAARNRR
jgi:hypothetical protein